MSISEEIKLAYQRSRDLVAKLPGDWLQVRDRVALLDAFVHERAMRLKAEFNLEHSGCQDGPDYDADGAPCKCEDERHSWTDAQWREEVEKELR